MPQPSPTNREVRLVRTREGLPLLEDFAIKAAPVPVPAADEVLVRNLCFLVSASLRQMLVAGAVEEQGVPFPVIRPGDPLWGEALGEVIAAPAGSDFAPGDLVVHFRGWRDHAAVPVAECRKVRDDLPDRTLHLGHGWTAYAALTQGAPVRAGDTVFVSSGGGAIGSMAAQVARLLGAARVIGSTGTRAKAARLAAELGYDAAVCREAGSIAAQLAEAAPDGIDLLVDNVGGEQFAAGVAACREGGRVLVLGTLAQQMSADGRGRAVPVDPAHILMKRLTICGYSACDDDAEARAEWDRNLCEWLWDGRLTCPRTIVDGLDAAPATFERTMRGDTLGAVIVRLA